MAKYENIRALAKKQLQAVTESSDRWKAFLRTAAIAYNYSFPNQLLIHEQSPTATAVADIAYWNNNAGRWVKRGAHGIAVFDTRANSSRLRYLFDISDTIPRAEIPEALPWVITDQNWRPVWDKIVADNHADSIQSALLMLSTSCVAQRSAMFTTALGKAIDGSSLQWAKPDEQRQLFLQLITQSCLYMAALRCGVDTARLDLSAIESVNQFDTNRIALCLGSACQQTARPLMQQIGSITREIDSVARAEKVRYYGDKQEETNNTKEVNNGVHDGERLPNPGADAERAADAGDRQVRQPAAEILARERADGVRRDDAGGNAVPASGGDGQRSTPANRTDHADADAAEHRPEPADRPDGLDAVDERLAEPSRGTGDAADLQPVTQEPQAESDTTPSAFSVPISDLPPLSDELILGLLAKESSSRADNAAILEYFNEHPDLAERSAFCKHCYKQIYTYLFVDDHTVGFIRHDMYLELWEGNYLTKTAQVNLTWDAVAAKIADLIEQGRLMVPIKATPVQQQMEQLTLTPEDSEKAGLPSHEQQVKNIDLAAEVKKWNKPVIDASGKYITEQDITDALCKGGGFEDSKFRIQQYLSAQVLPIEEDQARWLKKEYGIGGGTWIFRDGGHGFLDHMGKNLEITRRTEDGEYPFVRNFSYTVKDDKIYYREGAVMRECNPNAASAERIRKLVELRDTTRALIDAQLQDLSDEEIHRLQAQLNRQYDAFRAKHGLINSRSAELSFRDDSSYYLLCSLENVDEKGNFISKSDMFTKRTIRSAQIPDHADTASDALALSIGERAKVDMPYMMHLTGKDEATLAKELAGVIFVEPFRKQEDGSPVYLMADEYLSGNVREKLRIAHVAADQDPAFRINVEALEQVQPKDLTAGEITVRLGVTWIGPEIIKRFADELFQSTYREQKIAVRYNEYLNNWYISNKSQGNDNIRVTNTYGTKRINGYHLLENALNLRATKIYDTIYDENGKEQHKLNGPATEEAQAKQRMIEDAFKDWIFKDRERRESLVALYNEKFNCIRPREYDGSHIQFFGMNPEIALRPHQRNAIAHILYGHNTLLAHTVGAGKTYEMVAAAMEKKRLGLCSKTLVAVPNHLTGQFASEALKLYPNANILVTTQRDFEKSNRKRFCAKIATGNYDIVVIGHSQFEKIPLSDARKAEFIRKQIDELEMQLESMDNSDSRLTVKQLESKKKQLKTKLSNLLDAPKRDDVVTFEELGADSLMVDEAHNFKNLMTVTKMHNIAGISTTESQKASDLFMKCQYLDEITGARGVTFATGTPISNSMTELYTMQRYLQQYTLERNGLANFDSWAATFGETVTAIELAPEGTGYRTKTRFARFFNLPELMAMFKECADIQTADMLKLPVPALVGGKPTNIQLKPSEIQKQMVTELGERADKIRNKMVKPYEDNMLKITNDGRKLALDQRLIDPDLPDDPDSKVNICVGKIFEIWEQTMPQRSAQLVFCDLSTPKAGVFNVYDDMKAKLIERGIPETEIAFIHEANTDARKTELFGKVRSGAVRVLMGSTAKMGAGTNVQKRLIALHHLDVPWRPSDIEQREGRILRQGNENKEVYVFRYVTEGTFDAYSWQLIENKQKFIGQIMTSKSPARSCDDMDEAALSYAEVKALAAGNPLIKEKMDLDVQLTRLKTLKAAHDSQRYELENKIAIGFPAEIRKCKEQIENATVDAATVKEHSVVDADGKDVFCIQLEKKVYYEKEPAGKALLGLLGLALNSEKPVPIGYFKGMELQIQHLPFGNEYHARLAGSGTYSTQLGADVLGNLTRLSNLANGIEPSIEKTRNMQIQLEQQLASAEEEVKRPFPQATELTEKSKRLAVLEGLLNMNDKDIVTDTEPEQQCQTDNRQRGQEER